MAKKKQTQRKITVKKPIKGNEYYFKFAGGVLKGVLGDNLPSLEKHYNEKWYRMHVIERGREMRYPTPQRNLADKYEDFKED
jgi:hypothetical protein